jgi:hypothetical protein
MSSKVKDYVTEITMQDELSVVLLLSRHGKI